MQTQWEVSLLDEMVYKVWGETRGLGKLSTNTTREERHLLTDTTLCSDTFVSEVNIDLILLFIIY